MYQNYDLIVTTNYIKKEILKENSITKIISNTKILSINEFVNSTVGVIKPGATYFLMEKFNISYNLAKVYLKNIFYNSNKLKKYYDLLIEYKYIELPIINKYKNILLINVLIDDVYKSYYPKSVFDYFSLNGKNIHKITKYSTLELEISSVFNQISHLLKKVNINKIKLVNVSSEYINEIKKVSNMFKVPINLPEKYTISKTNAFDKFISNLRNTMDVETSLNIIKDSIIYDKILDYFNSYNYKEINNLNIEVIINELKEIQIKEDKITDAIECINYEDIYNKDNYYFVIGLNDGILPKIYKNEDFLSDEEKEMLNYNPSNIKNKFNKELFMNIYNSYKNIYYSYKLKSPFQSYRPSLIIEDNNLEVVEYDNENYLNSNLYNKLELAKSLDNLIKFGEYNNNLNILYSNYEIPYLSYDNKFTKIDNFNNICKDITLSYTSINDYYNCAFKYYVKKILKLDKSEESLALLIGNTFHFVLSKIYEPTFDLNQVYDEYLNSQILDNKSKLFMSILKNELVYIIDVIKSFDLKSTLNNNYLEKEITIKDIVHGKVKLYGIMDKLKVNEDNSLAIVIDYKTGSLSSSIDNINHGLNLQLPIYMYFAKSMYPDIKIGGFYLQKILNNPKVDESIEDKRKSLKLEGFSSSNIEVLKNIDYSYENSEVIKSLKLTKNGFASYSKVLSDKNIEEVLKITKEKIQQAASNIVNGNFSINPKEINNINIGCTYCKFKDLCFMKEEDIVKLEDNKIKDILGGEEDA